MRVLVRDQCGSFLLLGMGLFIGLPLKGKTNGPIDFAYWSDPYRTNGPIARLLDGETPAESRLSAPLALRATVAGVRRPLAGYLRLARSSAVNVHS